MRLLLITIAAVFCSVLTAQSSYSINVVSLSYLPQGRVSCTTSDKCFVVASPGNPITSIVLMKIDTVGNVLWIKQLDNSEFGVVTEMTETTDSGIVILGLRNAPSGIGKPYFLKLDKDGNVLFGKCFSASMNSNNAYALARCDSSGFAIAVHGFAGSNIILRYDSIGNLVWGYQYPNLSSVGAVPMSILQRANGNLVIAGYDLVNSTYVLKTFELSPIGGLVWYHTYDCGVLLYSWRITESASHDLFISGSTNGSVNPGTPCFLLKLDSTGNFAWLNFYMHQPGICVLDHVTLSDNTNMLGGWIYMGPPNSLEYVYFATDYYGVATWGFRDGNYTMNNQGDEVIRQLFNAGDDGVYSIGEAADGLSIHRFDTWGSSFCDPDTVVINTYSIIPVIDNPSTNKWPIIPIMDTTIVIETSTWAVPTINCMSITTSTSSVENVQPTIWATAGKIQLGAFYEHEFDQLSIFDINGRCVVRIDQPVEWMTIDLANHPPGIYLISLTGMAGTINRKLFVPAE